MSGRGKKRSAMSTILDQPTSKKRACTMIKDWPQKYFIELVVDDDSRVCCKICDKKFLIFHGEENITRHAAGPVHKTNVIRKNTSKVMTDFVMTKLDPNTK
jgi:hypothetical protein